jgi:hypothetical protein
MHVFVRINLKHPRVALKVLEHTVSGGVTQGGCAMSDGLKILLGALGGAILALLLAGGFSGSGMGYGMMGGMGQMMGAP